MVPLMEVSSRRALTLLLLPSDDSYRKFHGLQDFPVTKLLQQPLYFEVELLAASPRVSLELENCWATFDEDGTSQPRWNLIVLG